MSITVRRALLDDCAGLFDLIKEHALFERKVATLTPAELNTSRESDAPPVTILVARRATTNRSIGVLALSRLRVPPKLFRPPRR